MKLRILLFTALSGALVGCASLEKPAPPSSSLKTEPLRLNDIQVIGSHNSFRQMPPLALLDALEARRAGLKAAFTYDHSTLQRQLDLGVRQIELDVVADPDGGRYAKPYGEVLAGNQMRLNANEQIVMAQPGFKVLHLADLDYYSHCLTLKLCLQAMKDWSLANPRHLPITITIDAKERPHGLADVTDPLILSPDLLNALDQEVRDILGNKLITPDEVRGQYEDLRTAVLANQWPSLEQSRGRFLVVLDIQPQIANRYRQGHPLLTGRAMFAQYPETDPEAAFFIVQDPLVDEARIAALVHQGFMVRTRSDANTIEARKNDTAKMLAAMRSGAQSISTDYYPGAPDPLSTGFAVSFEGRAMVRCNVIRIQGHCQNLVPH
jgi:Phosphoinositide phospholipase C, Ca2+-dependent